MGYWSYSIMGNCEEYNYWFWLVDICREILTEEEKEINKKFDGIPLERRKQIIEHNLDMIKNADYIVDMGPEGGNKGGLVIATGSPEKLAAEYKETGSYTGEYLAKELE